MILALVVGTVLSLLVLGYVLAPLVIGVARQPVARPVVIQYRPEDMSIAALREVEFDRATGKLSDSDYAVLRERYTGEALTAMRSSGTPVTEDLAEAAVRAYRGAHPTCGQCGIRPEPDAIYCSNCGEFLPGKCTGCGTAVTAAGVRYCPECGTGMGEWANGKMGKWVSG